VVKEILERLPNRQIIYFGDTARVPYGNKSPELIKKYAEEGVEFLLSRGAQIIVIACNTMSAIAFDALKKKYDVPIFEVITPAVKKAVSTTENGRIGVIGTRATINSKIYEKRISNFQFPISNKNSKSKIQNPKSKTKVFSQPCPLFVPLAEEGWAEKEETEEIVKEYLKPLLKEKIDTLILGCTHYPMLKKVIKKVVGPKIKIVDSAEEVAKEVALFFEMSGFAFSGERPGHAKRGCEIFVSDKTDYLESWVGDWLGEDVEVEKVVLKE